MCIGLLTTNVGRAHAQSEYVCVCVCMHIDTSYHDAKITGETSRIIKLLYACAVSVQGRRRDISAIETFLMHRHSQEFIGDHRVHFIFT